MSSEERDFGVHALIEARRDIPPRLRRAGIVGLCGYRFSREPPLDLVVLPSLAVRVLVSVNGTALRVADAATPSPCWAESTAVAFGVRTRTALASAEHGLHCLQILLAPWAAFRLFGIPPRDLGGAASDLVPPGGDLLQAVVAAFHQADGWKRRFAIADAVLSWRCSHGPSPAPVVVKALEALRRSGGRVSVHALACACGCSERLLEQRFGEQVGASPKAVARVARLRRAVSLLSRGVAAGDIAVACGFCDQAHLTREFTAMIGSPPARFAHDHHVLRDGGEYECGFIQDTGRATGQDR